MDRQPAASTPAGYHGDMNDPRTTGLQLGLWVGVAGVAVSTIFLLPRLFTKIAFAKTFSLDDLFIVLSWALAMAVQSMLIYLRVTKRIGVHIWEISTARANETLLFLEIITILYLPIMAFAKTSLCLSYRKLSTNRLFQAAVWSTVTIIAAYSIAIILALVFACNPIQKSWDITIKSGHCINRGALHMATAAVNTATDLVLLLLPMPIIWNLTMSALKKFGLAMMFIIGFITLASSSIRLVVLQYTLENPDITWAVSTPALWTSIEISLVIICCCFPSLTLFVKRSAPRPNSDSASQSPYQDTEETIETSYRPRMRPLSELTLFKGRQNRTENWERMPDLPETRPGYSPATDVNLAEFDFQLSHELEGSAAGDEEKTRSPLRREIHY